MYPTLESTIGNTPLVRLQRMPGDTTNVILGKLEGNNPAGSVKDRPALSMIVEAEKRGDIKPGDTLIEATSGNTGIALAMVAAMKGYRMILMMPDNLSLERRQSMTAFGAELILVTKTQGMEGARDLADRMRAEGKGVILDQFANPDNPLAHYRATGPELWNDTHGRITHFVSAMGTTGTIMGVSKYLKEKNPAVTIVGAQPAEGASIPGIRKWPVAYLPKIYDARRVDRVESVTQQEAEEHMRRLAREEGIFGGVSSGGACAVALRIAQEVRTRRSCSSSAIAAIATCRRACSGMTPILVFDIETIPDVAGIRRICSELPAQLDDARCSSGSRKSAGRRRAAISRRTICSRSSPSRARCAPTTISRYGRSAISTIPSRSSCAAFSTASRNSRRSSCRGTAAASICRCSITAR